MKKSTDFYDSILDELKWLETREAYFPWEPVEMVNLLFDELWQAKQEASLMDKGNLKRKRFLEAALVRVAAFAIKSLLILEKE